MKSCSRIQFNIKQRPSILLVRSFPGFRNIIAWQSIYAGRKNPENAMERLTFMHAIVAVEEYLPLLKSCESIDLLPRIFLTYFTRHKYLVKQTFLFLLTKSTPQSFLFSFAPQIFLYRLLNLSFALLYIFLRRTPRRRSLCSRNLGTRNLGRRNLGTRNLGTRNLGTRNLGTRNLGARNLGNVTWEHATWVHAILAKAP